MGHKLNEDIQRIRALILEVEKVRISDVSYPNVKFEHVVTSDSLPVALLDDLQTAASSANMIITITAAKSDHKKMTDSGHVSRHYTGDAVDIAILDGIDSQKSTSSTTGSPEFRQKGNKLKDELVKLGYRWNVENINTKNSVLWQMRGHYDHLHVSNQSGKGSITPPEPPLSSSGTSTTPTLDDMKKTAEELYKEILDFKIKGASVKELLGITALSLSIIKDLDFFEILKAFSKSFEGIKRIPPEDYHKYQNPTE